MNIAILGAGFAGMATAWHLTHLNQCKVTVFDPAGIGGGSSGIAAGLLHPYAGPQAKLNWMGREGMKSTIKLIEASSNALEEPVGINSGMLRLALNESQQTDFSLAASKYSDIQWLSSEECQKLIPESLFKPGIFIHSAWTVYCQKYLEGLWKDCPGAILNRQAINHLYELDSFDMVIITMGIDSKTFSAEKLNPTKGQLLELEWPLELAPLPFPLNSDAYIVMKPGNKSCIVGATFEKQFKDSLPDMDVAITELKPKYTSMLPSLEYAKIIGCKAGIRAGTPDRHPLIKQINNRTWIFAGLGSKGLLHHSIMAEQLCSEIS
jgi:glycine/D-amino acid oxidase-like deaminating enzyme